MAKPAFISSLTRLAPFARTAVDHLTTTDGGWFHLRKRRTEAASGIYDFNLGIGEVRQVRLRANLSTGCSWWVESAPPSTVVGISVSEDVDPTVDCGNPPCLGCNNQIVVYSFKSIVPGDHKIELRYGHAWAHNEYYAVATIHLTVTGTHTKKEK